MHIAIGVLVGILVLLAAYFLFIQPASAPAITLEEEDELQKTNSFNQIEDESLVHSFDEGTHTVSGVIQLPTPCHTLTTDVAVAESFPEQVKITLAIPHDENICIQVIDDREFTVTFDASREARVIVQHETQTVTLPPLPAESLEE